MRIYLLILFIVISFASNAQIQKGSTLLGGSLNLNHADNGGTAFNINVQYAKAYKVNSFFGVKVGYGHSRPTNQNWNFYSGGIFYRKYVPVVKSFYFFGELGLDLNYAKLSGVSSNPSTEFIHNNYIVQIGLKPGLSYAVSSKLHLEIAFPDMARLYYNQEENKSTTSGSTFSTRNNSYGLSTSTHLYSLSNVQFGFRFLLQK